MDLFIQQTTYYREMLLIIDLIYGGFCEDKIPPKFCKNVNCVLCLRNGIMSLFNAQHLFVGHGVIEFWVKNADNQEVQQKTLQSLVPYVTKCKKCVKQLFDKKKRI